MLCVIAIVYYNIEVMFWLSFSEAKSDKSISK